MKTLLIGSFLALTATQARADDWAFRFVFGHAGDGMRIAIGAAGAEARHRHEPACCRRHWVDGHYEMVSREVWVPGYYETVARPVARGPHGRHGRHGRHAPRVVCYERVYVPGHYEIRTERIWHPGYWAYDCSMPGHRH